MLVAVAGIFFTNLIFREKLMHNGNLYAIWNGKSFLLSRTSKENIYSSDYFFWVDIGCFREKNPFVDWPNAGNENILLFWS